MKMSDDPLFALSAFMATSLLITLALTVAAMI